MWFGASRRLIIYKTLKRKEGDVHCGHDKAPTYSQDSRESRPVLGLRMVLAWDHWCFWLVASPAPVWAYVTFWAQRCPLGLPSLQCTATPGDCFTQILQGLLLCSVGRKSPSTAFSWKWKFKPCFSCSISPYLFAGWYYFSAVYVIHGFLIFIWKIPLPLEISWARN